MIVGIPNKLNLFARTRVAKRAEANSQNKAREKREENRLPSPFSAYGMMMERHVELVIRQMGE